MHCELLYGKGDGNMRCMMEVGQSVDTAEWEGGSLWEDTIVHAYIQSVMVS